MLKKLLNSVACVIIISLILNLGVFAIGEQSGTNDNTKLNNACFRLLSLDAVDEAMLGNGDAEVTRGGVAHLILKLLGYDSSFISDDAVSRYIDVSNDCAYKKDIILATELNLVNGYPDNTFQPDEFIKHEDIVTILVKALGYVDMAQNSGGYVLGYLSIAAQIGLLNGIVMKDGEAVTYNDLFLIFNNALDAEIVTKTFGSEGYLVKNGQTLFDVKIDALHLSYGKGRVNKNHVTSLYADGKKTSEDQVMIGEQYFYVGNTNASDMLAYDVEYYAEEDLGSDIATLKNIRINAKTSSVIIKAEQIDSVTSARITYDKKEKLDLENQLNVIYNMKLAENFEPKDLMIKNGTLEIVDTDNNGAYETIFIREYQLLTIDSVNVERGIINFKNQTLNGRKSLQSTLDKDYDIKVYDDSKNELSFADIQEDDVIEVYSSTDGKIIRIYVIKNTVTGKIESKSTENNKTYVTIEGAEYEVNLDDTELAEQIDLGVAGAFYVNSDNIIVKYAEETELQKKIALVQQIDTAGGLGGAVGLRLVNVGAGKTKEEDTDDDGILDTRYLEISNSGIEVYECADRVLLNNNRINKSELGSYIKVDTRYPKNNSVIQYELNSENKINRIDIVQPYGDGAAIKKLNVRAKLFGGSSNSFIMDNSTKIISVPPELTNGYEEELFLTVSKLADASDFEVVGLDVDADTKIAKAVVIVTPASAGASTINSRTKVSVIGGISRCLVEDQDVYKLSGFNGAGSYLSYTTDTVRGTYSNLSVGDLILYSQDYKSRINNIELVKAFKDLNEYYYVNKDNRVETYGKAVSVRTNYVPDSATDLQNLITLDVSNSGTPYEVKVLSSAINKPPIYVYDGQSDKIYAGSVTDIQTSESVGTGEASDVFVLSQSGTVKVILVIDK